MRFVEPRAIAYVAACLRACLRACLAVCLAVCLGRCDVPRAVPPPASPIPAPPPLWAPAPREANERAATSPAEVPKPSVDAPKPSVDAPKPSVDAPKPSVDAPKPSVDAPKPSVEIEPPYKLGERPTARTTAAYKREIAELRHWGKGGTGELLAAAPGVDGHPDPRVTVNVVGATGPHKISEIQRLSRRNHWINVIRCYRLGAYLDPNLRGWTKAVIDIQKTGNVKATQLLETELLDPAVAACIVEKLRGLKFSAQRQGTRASFEIRVSPGDEPMPPPTELIVPGDGQLAPEKILAVVDAALPRIEACFAAALAYAPGLWGRMLLRMHLSEQGKLDEVFEAGTQFPDPRTSQCVVHAARKLKFPKPEGGELRFVVGLRFFSDASAHALPIVPPPRSP